ncbi:hypothetical protein MBLNU230_g4665t1 [Neophaeotheca triangularis]
MTSSTKNRTHIRNHPPKVPQTIEPQETQDRKEKKAMPNQDNDLLARLHALKPSSITTLDPNAHPPKTAQNPPAAPAHQTPSSLPPGGQESIDDKLAARLKSLRSATAASSSPCPSFPKTSSERESAFVGSAPRSAQHVRFPRDDDPAAALTARVRDGVATEGVSRAGVGAGDGDAVADWQAGFEAGGEVGEQSLEALLAELGESERRAAEDGGGDGEDEVGRLLREARGVLPREGEEVAGKGGECGVGREGKEGAGGEGAGGVGGELKPNFAEIRESKDGDDEGEKEGKGEDWRDEEEADDYVARVLAELEVERKYGADDEGGTQDDNDGDRDANDKSSQNNALDLPATPSKLPELPPTTSTSAKRNAESEPPTYEDSELEARFSKLGLDLPSTPTSAPTSSKKTSKTIPKAKPPSNSPKYTDEDVDSWCCICNEDGEEGHGTGPGQERGHRAVQFVRKGGGGGGGQRLATA